MKEGTSPYKCVKCIEDYINARNAAEKDGTDPPSPSMLNDAITLVPSWQQQMVGPQLIMTCVTVPTCLDHIEKQDATPAQRALSSGLSLPGMS